MITIRLATVADAAALSAFARDTFADTFAGTAGDDDFAAYLARAYGVPQQSAELASPDVRTLVGESEGAIVAYAQLRRGPAPPCVTGEHPLELWRFYVARALQGSGVAQVLMARAMAEAQSLDARTLWLGVWEHNPRAQAFYRKCGFMDVGAHVFMVGNDAQTDRVMARPLA